MKIYGTWDAFLVEQLAEHGDVSGYLSAVIEEYQTHGNIATIQIALQRVIEAQGGIAELAQKTDLAPQALLEALENTKVPRIDTLRTVLSAFGCCLPIESLETIPARIAVPNEGSAVASESVDPNHNLD